MARKKVRLEYIENDSVRRVTYRKRVKGLVKKTKELSVLCGVEACTIIYGPYEDAPVVWPESDAEVRRVIEEFRGRSDMEQSQRKLDQQSFLQQSVAKAEEKLLRKQRENREVEMELLMSELLVGKPIIQVSYADVNDLLWVIEDRLRSVEHSLGLPREENPTADAALATPQPNQEPDHDPKGKRKIN